MMGMEMGWVMECQIQVDSCLNHQPVEIVDVFHRSKIAEKNRKRINNAERNVNKPSFQCNSKGNVNSIKPKIMKEHIKKSSELLMSGNIPISFHFFLLLFFHCSFCVSGLGFWDSSLCSFSFP